METLSIQQSLRNKRTICSNKTSSKTKVLEFGVVLIFSMGAYKKTPNKACSGWWGFCGFDKHFSGFGFFPTLRHYPRPPHHH